MAEKGFKGLIKQAKQRDSYWVGKAIQDFTEDLHALMESRGVSKADLAKRLDSSPAYVTKVLRGNTNFTIDSMVRLVRALDGELHIHVGRREDSVRWFDVIGQRGTDVQQVRQQGFRQISESYVVDQVPLEVNENEPDPAAA